MYVNMYICVYVYQLVKELDFFAARNAGETAPASLQESAVTAAPAAWLDRQNVSGADATAGVIDLSVGDWELPIVDHRCGPFLLLFLSFSSPPSRST